MDKKSFVTLGPGPNVIRLFMAVSYHFHNKLEHLFVPGKPFQTSLKFAGKVGAYPSEAPFRCSTLE